MAHHHHEHEHKCCSHELHEHEHKCCSYELHEHEHKCCSQEHHHEHSSMRRSITLIIVTALLLAVAVAIEHYMDLPTWQLLLIYLIPYLIIGHDTLKEAAEGVAHGDMFNEHFLMAIATIGALCIGFMPGAETEFPEAVFVMLFFQIGELFEDYAEGQSRRNISHVMDIRPDVARVESGDTVAAADVAVGTVIVVRPGERIPLDGVITQGSSNLNTMALTGESMPRTVAAGDEVYSGCINMGQELHVRTTKSFGQSTASKILELVENASERKSQSETFITRFARIYTPVVVVTALFIAIVPTCWELFFLHPSPFTIKWIYRSLLFLVVSCPCALVISVPLTFFGGLGGASRRGILIKGSNYMDLLAKVSVVVFDKTGTLTHGQVDGKTVMHDDVKADSAEAIRRLHDLGVKKTVMLTGDREEVASQIAHTVGISEYHAELLPADKVAHVERLLSTLHSPLGPRTLARQEPSILAFVGDGINDAPVLARADVGIAMGALGSDAAIEAADVVLMDDQPSKVADAILTARRTISIARQNVTFAIGIKVAVLILAFLGLATMWMAVFADVGVTVLAVLNAMRALKA